MARFYAEIQGARGEASRLGHAQSGIRSSTKSWNGEVNVRMWSQGEDDYCIVTLCDHGGGAIGGGASIVLYEGRVGGWRDIGPLGRRALEAATRIREEEHA